MIHYKVELLPPVPRRELSAALTRSVSSFPYHSLRGTWDTNSLIWVIQERIGWNVGSNYENYQMARSLVDVGRRDPVEVLYIRPAMPEYSEPPVTKSMELSPKEVSTYLEALQRELKDYWVSAGAIGSMAVTAEEQR